MGRSWLVGGLLLGIVGCGDVSYDHDQARAAQSAQCPPTAGGEQGTADELSSLLAELLAPRICERVVGNFIGLPGDQTHDGSAAGLDPSVGRWWIRQCNADVSEGRLRVAITGSGWSWLDRESNGFRVRQYLRFDAGATFTASLHVGYDTRTRIATVWLRPDPGVQAQVTPQGLLRAEATGLFSSLVGGLLDLTGSSANDRARQQAADEGSQLLSQRLAGGFTVTYDLNTEQMDFLLGQLERGQTPQRPWPNGDRPWVLNERSAVWPGGLDVVGPIPANAGIVDLDLELEEGEGATIRQACADDIGHWLDQAWNGQNATPPGDPIADLHAPHAPQVVRLQPRECRSALLVSPRAQTTLPVMLRYRATPEAPTPGTTTTVATVAYEGTGNVPPAYSGTMDPSPTSTRPVRVEVQSLSVAAQTSAGGAWDVVGGQPDPYVVISSIPNRREIDRTPTVNDSRDVRFDRALPGALRVEDFPIRFVVYDEDVTNDELIGTADVEASAVRATAIDLVLDVRSSGTNPVQTGILRVRLTPL